MIQLQHRNDLPDAILEAVKANGGNATIPQICKHIWDNHENDLRKAGELFYTWQYEMRWAGQKLRKSGDLLPANRKVREWRVPPK
jgi:hypothetical protein